MTTVGADFSTAEPSELFAPPNIAPESRPLPVVGSGAVSLRGAGLGECEPEEGPLLAVVVGLEETTLDFGGASGGIESVFITPVVFDVASSVT